MTINKSRVIWSKIAQERLGEIHFWHILDYSERRADKVINSIEKAVDEIAKFPSAAPVYEELEPRNDSIRAKLVHGTYKVVYKFDESAVYIIDIFHTAQDPDLSEIDVL